MTSTPPPRRPDPAGTPGPLSPAPRRLPSAGGRFEALLAAAHEPASTRKAPRAPARDPDEGPPERPLRSDLVREPGPACFSTVVAVRPETPASRPVSGAAAPLDPCAVAAMAEQVLRTLRVGRDHEGRAIVQLEIAAGAFAGCRIDLRRHPSGVELTVRRDGRTAPGAEELTEALRRRGIPVI